MNFLVVIVQKTKHLDTGLNGGVLSGNLNHTLFKFELEIGIFTVAV